MQISEELYQYVVDIRRTLHRHPEIGFDLPMTCDLVRKELDKIGFPYSEAFSPCSFVVYVGNDPAKKTLGVRADMDALPVEEWVDVPYKSEFPGKMHACGHDTHTAILLGLAKLLKAHEAELSCNVRLFFQPSEECEESGAEVMAKNGCLEGVDSVICTHCEPTLEPDEIGYAFGDYMAGCSVLTARFYGKTSHAAAAPEKGIDAIRMGYEAYSQLYPAVKEIFGDKRYIFNIGVFKGGTAHNVIADYCELVATFRWYDEPSALRFMDRTREILNGIADRFGGRVEIEMPTSTYPVYNDPELTKQFIEVIGKKPDVRLKEMPQRMSSEDFSWFLHEKPGFIFRYGIRNDATGCCSPAHSNTFKVEEKGFKTALSTFFDYIMSYK